ncbi:Zn-dependent exopeptidase [Collybia nuda]|uniref:Peptide hydrolase n=1 Tax=Collybia nuda TaxID=64659 RepID=A0A9P6CCD9_9AGAR|nr:Zn-dependent exopeptidase [Collybia nuda]
MAKVVLPLALLFVTPFDPSLLVDHSCLSNNFYGNYHDAGKIWSVLLPDTQCLETWTSKSQDTSASIVQPKTEIQQLVWLEEEAVDVSVKTQTRSFQNEFDSFLDALSDNIPPDNSDLLQLAMGMSIRSGEYELLYRTPSAALLSVSHDKARTIDTVLPRFWKSTLLPTSPVTFRPVVTSAISHVERILSQLKFDPVVASTVNNISLAQMKKDIKFLTGEDGKSGIISRHSFSTGALTAASWLKDLFQQTGATCELRPFLIGFAPNVICRYPAVTNTTATVLLSAHYDSRGSFGKTRAPGADDDGSGIVALLSIARTILRKGVKFYSNVELVAFAGEEQGLLGSRAYARELRVAGANLTLMIQADMLAYRAPGEPPQLGLPDKIGSPIVTQLVADVSAIYSPELHVGFTPACCSDHQSFHEQGFPATQVFERAGPIADPMYHNSGDLSDRVGYDFGQLKSIAKVQFATLLHTAGFKLSQ